ncbi:c-type cytochrome biogenesis protein CcsB, partial [bacterium]|nr:c-type cytochrome biogenesis protein CcsB [bacterium]
LVLFVGFCFNTVVIINRWMEAGRPPFKTLFESLILFSWCIILLYLIIEMVHKVRIIGIFSTITSVIILTYSLLKIDVDIINLPAALQSGWFIPHVVIYFLGYSALFISFVTGILFLFFPEKRKLTDNNLLGQEYLDFDQYTYKVIVFGFTMLTIGLLIGALWAKEAWGDYWVWDPKETWSLISWMVYIVYFHFRFVKGWRGKKAAWLSILGFLAIMITYLGMNVLPTASQSEHVYQ